MTDYNFPKLQIKSTIAVPDATFVSNPFKMARKQAEILEEMNKKIKEERMFEAQKKAKNDDSDSHSKINKMINDEAATPEHLDKEKTAQMIVDIAQEVGVNPVVVASLAKHETGFNQNKNGATGKGAMQITKISIQDMYQKGRESFYDEKLTELKKKYKTPEALYSAIQKDHKLNITTGTILFKSKLKIAKGNLAKAFELYNGGGQKKQYSKDLMKIYNQYNNLSLEA